MRQCKEGVRIRYDSDGRRENKWRGKERGIKKKKNKRKEKKRKKGESEEKNKKKQVKMKRK
jgi:hypothetical protein